MIIMFSVVIDGKAVDFVYELKYLGWFIMSAKTFRVNAHHMRAQFFSVLILMMLIEAVILQNLCCSIF